MNDFSMNKGISLKTSIGKSILQLASIFFIKHYFQHNYSINPNTFLEYYLFNGFKVIYIHFLNIKFNKQLNTTT